MDWPDLHFDDPEAISPRVAMPGIRFTPPNLREAALIKGLILGDLMPYSRKGCVRSSFFTLSWPVTSFLHSQIHEIVASQDMV
jgi:hypothetical protein